MRSAVRKTGGRVRTGSCDRPPQPPPALGPTRKPSSPGHPPNMSSAMHFGIRRQSCCYRTISNKVRLWVGAQEGCSHLLRGCSFSSATRAGGSIHRCVKAANGGLFATATATGRRLRSVPRRELCTQASTTAEAEMAKDPPYEVCVCACGCVSERESVRKSECRFAESDTSFTILRSIVLFTTNLCHCRC